MADASLVRRLGLGLSASCATLSATFLAAICALTVMEVVLRYIAGRPTAWSNDVIGLCMAGLVFAALPWITYRNAHIAIPLLPDALPPTVRRVYLVVIGLAGIVILTMIAWLIWRVFQQHVDRGTLTSGVVRVPRWWLSGGMLLGFAGAGLAWALRIADAPPPFTTEG